jgi:hypothetical protein
MDDRSIHFNPIRVAELVSLPIWTSSLTSGKRTEIASSKNNLAPKSHGNDGSWKAWKAIKPAFHPSNAPWKSLRGFPHYHGYDYDYH